MATFDGVLDLHHYVMQEADFCEDVRKCIGFKTDKFSLMLMRMKVIILRTKFLSLGFPNIGFRSDSKMMFPN